MVKRRVLIRIYVAVAIVAFSYFSTMIPSSSGQEGLADLARVEPEDLPLMASTPEAIRILLGRVKRNPNSVTSYTSLGRMHIRQARETGDVTSYLRAEDAFRRALEIMPNYSAAEASLASTLYTQHDFAGALEMARQVYQRDPQNDQALAIVGDAYFELGNYEEAEDAYQALLRKSNTTIALVRLARLAELKGNTDGAVQLMERATAESLDLGISRESIAWYLLRLGDLNFNAGRVDEAAVHYESSLRVFDNYYLALAGMGKVRAAQGRHDEAIDLYEQAAAVVPQPATLAALGDLYAKTGDTAQAQLRYDTVEFIAKLAAINKQVYNRVLALFYADHNLNLDEALTLATRELEVRKDIYGYDTLAWALYKNGLFDEAAEAISQALKLGTQDAKLFYHAAMIFYSQDDRKQALEFLERALDLNPHFSVLYEENAQRMVSELRSDAVLASAVKGGVR